DDDLESLLHVRALHNSRSMQSQAAGRLTRAANWHRDVAWNQRFSRSYLKLTRSARYRPICPPSGDLRIRVQDVRDTWSCVTADPVSRVGSPRGPIQARRECAGAEMPRFARAQETDHRRPRRRVRRISNPTRTRAVPPRAPARSRNGRCCRATTDGRAPARGPDGVFYRREESSATLPGPETAQSQAPSWSWVARTRPIGR